MSIFGSRKGADIADIHRDRRRASHRDERDPSVLHADPVKRRAAVRRAIEANGETLRRLEGRPP